MTIESVLWCTMLVVLFGGSNLDYLVVNAEHSDDQLLDDHNPSPRAPAENTGILFKVSDVFSRATQLKLNCTDVEHCDEPASHEMICWMQAVAIVVSFCLFVFCYLQYRIRSKTKRMFKSQVFL